MQMKCQHQSSCLQPNALKESSLIGHVISMGSYLKTALKCVFLTIYCVGSLGVAKRESIPVGRVELSRRNKVHFVGVDQGCSMHQG